jgi:hypothetical protein
MKLVHPKKKGWTGIFWMDRMNEIVL